MREKVYVDRLFADYEDSPEIRDFKEEIAANLKERVNGLTSEGIPEEKAFDKAAGELGDITAIADEVAKKKRNETIGQMYMHTKIPFARATAAGLAAASGLVMLAVSLVLIAFFGEADRLPLFYFAVVFFSAACGMYTFFGLRQETAAHYAMGAGRAAAYAFVCLIAVIGAGIGVVAYLFTDARLLTVFIIKAVFVLPAVSALVFLLTTERDRHKPWVKAYYEYGITSRQYMPSGVSEERFGVLSGGMWVFTVAVFATLRLAAGWRHSWVVFLFAAAIQIFMTTMIFSKKK